MTYDVGHKLHGTSEYDVFKLQLVEDTDGKWWVYARRLAIPDADIELLSEIENGNES